ncbi:hypothetical protein SB778_03505 [Paraburkholderia sp. SIMBA_050]
MGFTDPKDQENLMTIAKEVAKATVEEMGLKLRERDEELRESIVEDVRKELKSYFGDQSPSDHLIQHNRIDKLLNWIDNLGKNFWGGLIAGTVKFLVVAIIGAAVFSKYKG